MTISDELVQRVDVKATVQGGSTTRMNMMLSKIMFDCKRDVERNLEKVVQNIGKEVGSVAKYQQHAGLVHYRAIFTHRLYDSIHSKKVTSGGLHSVEDIGTNINEMYPLYLIKGRKHTMYPKKAKALRFRLTPNGEYLYRAWVKPSKPKDYVKYADDHTKPLISGIVGRYVNELFR